MNPLQELRTHGQSVWLDFLSRGFIADGELAKLVDEDGLAGVTSNPSIFEKAIGHSDEYDDDLRRALDEQDVSVGDLFIGLAIDDIRHAADVLRPVYDATGGADGFVSLEVSPYIALDTEATIAEGCRLWQRVDRPNLMVKVPATPAGLPAIRELTAEGVNVNITLLFSQEVYRRVVEAYLGGLATRKAKGADISRIASVASFFVSRIDTAVDNLLDEKIRAANDANEKKRLQALKGKVAIANAKLAYQDYKRLFTEERWQQLAAANARPQRLLWASTGTKNKAYSDVLYVEELIGRDTVNTMPPATLAAFRDHGEIRDSLEEDVNGARQIMVELERTGISIDEVTDKLVDDGVRLFADAADKLFGAVAAERTKILGTRLSGQELKLGAIEPPYRDALEAARADGLIRRLWNRDKTLWTGADEDKWLGWLDSVAESQKRVGDYESFAEEVRREEFTDALLLGMGGSSLGPEVLGEVFGNRSGCPKLRIVDSTDPTQVRTAAEAVDLARTLVIVSSKSGSTTEPNVLKDYFFNRISDVVGSAHVGSRFVAVTDPGSSLEQTAVAQGFRRTFFGTPSIGGRYSVLSPFGLVPAAAAGIDMRGLLEDAATMVRACGPDVPPSDNPGVQFGLALGVAALHGRNKITILASGRLADFGAWAEQLLAESTGKNGKGLIPVDAEPIGPPNVYGDDRLFVHLSEAEGNDGNMSAALSELEKAGHPVIRITMSAPDKIGQEFFRWEIATAVAGAVIGINPFDQPDVEASKIRTRELTAAFERTGALPQEEPVFSDSQMAIFADRDDVKALQQAGAADTAESWLRAHIGRSEQGDYFAILAFIPREPRTAAMLQRMRLAVRERRRIATCVGFGPRFLHSTGQAYKGGPNSGVFLQITADPEPDLAIPGQKASFGVIAAAQARGDFEVLAERGRRALRIHIEGELESGLTALDHALKSALA